MCPVRILVQINRNDCKFNRCTQVQSVRKVWMLLFTLSYLLGVFFMSRTVKGYRKSATRALHYRVMLQTVDSDYIREEQRFKNMESAVKLMVRDVAKYLHQLRVSAGSFDCTVVSICCLRSYYSYHAL